MENNEINIDHELDKKITDYLSKIGWNHVFTKKELELELSINNLDTIPFITIPDNWIFDIFRVSKFFDTIPPEILKNILKNRFPFAKIRFFIDLDSINKLFKQNKQFKKIIKIEDNYFVDFDIERLKQIMGKTENSHQIQKDYFSHLKDEFREKEDIDKITNILNKQEKKIFLSLILYPQKKYNTLNNYYKFFKTKSYGFIIDIPTLRYIVNYNLPDLKN